MVTRAVGFFRPPEQQLDHIARSFPCPAPLSSPQVGPPCPSSSTDHSPAQRGESCSPTLPLSIQPKRLRLFKILLLLGNLTLESLHLELALFKMNLQLDHPSLKVATLGFHALTQLKLLFFVPQRPLEDATLFLQPLSALRPSSSSLPLGTAHRRPHEVDFGDPGISRCTRYAILSTSKKSLCAFSLSEHSRSPE